jgi:5-methylthioadenosine/S-adenosylhomocysteine deaminase
MNSSSVTMRAAWVISGDEAGTVWSPGEVRFEDGVITYAGPPRPGVASGRLIDLGQGAVAPGLVNGHNHAPMALMRGLADDSRLMPWLEEHVWPVERHLTADDVYVGTLLAAAEMIRSGTVGFADMYDMAPTVARAVRESGLRGAISWGITGDLAEKKGWVDDVVAFAKAERQQGGLVQGWLGPHAPYTMSPALMEYVGAEAERHGLGIHVHLAESDEEMRSIRLHYGCSPVALAQRTGLIGPRTLVAHGVYLDPDDIRLLAEGGAGVVHCPASNLKLGNGIAPVVELQAQGVTVGLGTDGPASTNSLDMFQEMRLTAWLQKSRLGDPGAFSARHALGLATAGSARILGTGGGALEAGRPADIMGLGWWHPHVEPVLDPISTLVYASSPQDVRYTVVAGRILLDDGVITSFDEEAVMREATGRARALLARAGQ